MADHEFVIESVRDDPFSRACRLAVLAPVFHRRHVADAEVPVLYDELRVRWHDRLRKLRDAGWRRIQPELRLQYARNCPPFGVRQRGVFGWRPCTQPRVCPWCYMRLCVAGPLASLLACVREQPGRLHLRTVEKSFEVPAGPNALKAVRDKLQGRINVSPAFCATVTVYQPWAGEELAGFDRRVLGLCAEPSERTVPATVDSVLEAAPRVLAYPTLALSTPPKTFVALLEAMSRVRLVRTTGAAYGRAGGPGVGAGGVPDEPRGGPPLR